MRKRKTVDVDAVKAKANSFLMLSQPDKAGEREGVASLLETILHATGNYKGFKYITQHDLANFGMEERYQEKHIGMVWNGDGIKPTYVDETRRIYY